MDCWLFKYNILSIALAECEEDQNCWEHHRGERDTPAASWGDPGEFWLFLSHDGRLAGLMPVHGTLERRVQQSILIKTHCSEYCFSCWISLLRSNNQSEDSMSRNPDQWECWTPDLWLPCTPASAQSWREKYPGFIAWKPPILMPWRTSERQRPLTMGALSCFFRT